MAAEITPATARVVDRAREGAHSQATREHGKGVARDATPPVHFCPIVALPSTFTSDRFPL